MPYVPPPPPERKPNAGRILEDIKYYEQILQTFLRMEHTLVSGDKPFYNSSTPFIRYYQRKLSELMYELQEVLNIDNYGNEKKETITWPENFK